MFPSAKCPKKRLRFYYIIIYINSFNFTILNLINNMKMSKNNLSSSIGNIAEIDVSLGDSVYYWTKSGTVSSGTFTNSTAYRSAVSYTLPTGETPNTIVAIGIASNNNCYYWYS